MTGLWMITGTRRKLQPVMVAEFIGWVFLCRLVFGIWEPLLFPVVEVMIT